MENYEFIKKLKYEKTAIKFNQAIRRKYKTMKKTCHDIDVVIKKIGNIIKDAKVSVNRKMRDSITPLESAFNNKQINIINILISAGANLEETYDGKTLIRKAIKPTFDSSIIKYLVEYNAPYHNEDLYHAWMSYTDTRKIEYLLKHPKCNIDAEIHLGDTQYKSILDVILYNSFLIDHELFDILLNNGADPNKTDFNTLYIYDIIYYNRAAYLEKLFNHPKFNHPIYGFERYLKTLKLLPNVVNRMPENLLTYVRFHKTELTKDVDENGYIKQRIEDNNKKCFETIELTGLYKGICGIIHEYCSITY